jgi:hypothetical protein
MVSPVLPINQELSSHSRLRRAIPAALRGDWAEILFLVLMGVLAAALTTFVHLRMRIPGHAILLSVVPMTFGLAAAPRRGAGLLMGFTAVLSATAFDPQILTILREGGGGGRLGAMTSLGLTGILLNLAASRASCGKRLYFGFACAGLASNLAAFAVKGSQKFAGLDMGSRPLAEWIPVAPVSYVVCGLLAGLISAGLFFQFSERGPTQRREDPDA